MKPNVPITNILGMLELTYDLRRFRLLEGEIGINTIDELFQRAVSILADRVQDRVRRGLYRHCVERTEDLCFVHGRADRRGIFANLVRQDPYLRCRYDELTADLEDNQILLWTLYAASKARLDREDVARNVSQGYRALAGSMKLTNKNANESIGRFYHRLNDDYRSVHGLCRLILEHTGPGVSAGGDGLVPFTLNMPTLFDAFVAKWLKANLPDDYRVREQYTARLQANAVLKLRIDIVIEEKGSGRPVMVLDTKYTNVTEPAQDDVQQAAADAVEMRTRTAVLAYPSALPKNIRIQSENIDVQTAAFDLDRDLSEAGEDFLRQVRLAA